MSRFAHVPASTVRFWASLDTAAGGLVATPWGAELFVRFLYWGNGLIGGESVAPPFTPVQLLFVCLMGALVSVWVVARWLHPTGLMSVVDAWGRSYVGMLLAWFILVHGAPPILWLFVFTEWAGAVGQFRAAYFPFRRRAA